MRRRLAPLVVAMTATSLASCASSDEPSGGSTAPETTSVVTTTTANTGSTTSSPTTADTTSTSPAPAPDTPETRALELCSSRQPFVLGQVENPTLNEASGLVASRRHPEVLWTHNDGSGAGLFGLGIDGTDLGFHPLVIDGARDVEDIAVVSGPHGDDILLADIGDNGARRPGIRIYRFAEPNPSVIAPITDVQVLDFTYPDRPHNAEVLLVDESNNRIVLVTKEQQQVDGLPPELGPTAPAFIFEGPLDGESGEPIVLTAAGTLDAPLLETRTVSTTPSPSACSASAGCPPAVTCPPTAH